jgi:hypothetical protein
MYIHRDAQQEGFRRIVMYHGAAFVPRLREFSAAKRIVMMLEASEVSLVNELHMPPFDKKRFIVPSWGRELLTGAQVVGLMAFGMWVHVGEDEERAAVLLAEFPEILDARKLGYLDR